MRLLLFLSALLSALAGGGVAHAAPAPSYHSCRSAAATLAQTARRVMHHAGFLDTSPVLVREERPGVPATVAVRSERRLL